MKNPGYAYIQKQPKVVFAYFLVVVLHCAESVSYEQQSLKTIRNADHFVTHSTFIQPTLSCCFFLQALANKLRNYC